MSYRLLEKARNDLEEIWFYTFKNWSEEQADKYVGAILDEIEYLAAYPDSGRDQTHIREGYKYSQVKSHLIYYRVIKHGKEVEVVRVLHKRMDIENRLLD